MSYHLIAGVAGRRPCASIAWGGSQRFLPLFVSFAFFRALWNGRNGTIRLIHIGDPVLAPVGMLLGLLLRAPVVVTAHGLDVTFPNRIYQSVMSRVLPRMAAVVAISRETRDECLRRGVQSDRCWVVPVGIDSRVPWELTDAEARQRLQGVTRVTLAGRSVLVTVGRLVSRKGVAWFIEAVLPEIVARRPDVLYVVVGTGPDRERIEKAIRRRGLEDHAVIVGAADDQTVWAAYEASDLAVFPNIAVSGDIEGFGIVALEAGVAGRCVVASDLEGLRDAIQDGVNGVLVSSGNAAAWTDEILRLLGDHSARDELGSRGRQYVRDRFDWPRIVDCYLTVFDRVVAAR